MPIHPTNCYLCKKPWTGVGPICPSCMGILQPPVPPPLPICNYCLGFHDIADCLKAAVSYHTAKNLYNHQLNMASRKRNPYTQTRRTGRTSYDPAPLKYCPVCKSNYVIESKAGTICTSCHTVVHNPCRNCTSSNTHGVQGPNEQFVECGDCQFIE